MSSATFSWGDPDAGLFGSVGPQLALLFADGALAASAVGDAADTTVETGYDSWRVGWASEESGWDLAFTALTPALGSDRGCRVTGTVHAGDRRIAVDCLGQRSEGPGRNDSALSRTLSAWLDAERFVSVTAARPAGAEGHDDEDVEAWIVTPDDDGPVRLDEARISTTYDCEGRPVRAGLELWATPDSPYPRRVGGELRCGTSLALGAARLDATFFAWTMDGHRGVGRYDVLRHP